MLANTPGVFFPLIGDAPCIKLFFQTCLVDTRQPSIKDHEDDELDSFQHNTVNTTELPSFLSNARSLSECHPSPTGDESKLF
jgi:hypothetical protein